MSKGGSLKELLGPEAIACLAHNISLVHRKFDRSAFQRTAMNALEPLSILQRGQHLASALRNHLPARYEAAVEILIASLTPPVIRTTDLGLNTFFYLPHVAFVGKYGLNPDNSESSIAVAQQSLLNVISPLRRMSDWAKPLPCLRNLKAGRIGILKNPFLAKSSFSNCAAWPMRLKPASHSSFKSEENAFACPRMPFSALSMSGRKAPRNWSSR